MTSLVLLSVISYGFSNPEAPSKHPGNYNLFTIDRSRDPDIIMYDVNLDSRGNLNRSMPISVYWKRISKESQFEPLTRIQNKMGYGIKFQNISENKAEFQFVSSLDRLFELRKCSDNHYRVFTICDSHKVELKSLYIHFKDNSSWIPAITKIDLYGIDTASGGIITESIVP